MEIKVGNFKNKIKIKIYLLTILPSVKFFILVDFKIFKFLVKFKKFTY